jgi:hypothetical protein
MGNRAHLLQPGMTATGTNLTSITDNIFKDNQFVNGVIPSEGFSSGGLRAVAFVDEAPIITNNCFENNQGSSAGALAVTNGDNVLIANVMNNRFLSNLSNVVNGGAVWMDQDGLVEDNFFANNQKFAIRVAGAENSVDINRNQFFNSESGLLLAPFGTFLDADSLNAQNFAEDNSEIMFLDHFEGDSLSCTQ